MDATSSSIIDEEIDYDACLLQEAVSLAEIGIGLYYYRRSIRNRFALIHPPLGFNDIPSYNFHVVTISLELLSFPLAPVRGCIC